MILKEQKTKLQQKQKMENIYLQKDGKRCKIQEKQKQAGIDRIRQADRLRALLGALLVQIYPNRCPVCNRVLYEALICPQCAAKLKYNTGSVCFSCGKPLEDEEQEYCFDCMEKKHEFRQGRAVFQYQGAVQGILYRYKYSNRRDYTEFLAAEAARMYAGWVRKLGIDLAVPIPLSRKRMRQRGYNQAEVFARRFCELCGLRCSTKLLVRTRNTAPQKKLSAQERKNNMKNAFKINGNVVNLNRILLVDDIYTTGSTIDAAALAFRQSGIENIYFLCISIGQGQQG